MEARLVKTVVRSDWQGTLLVCGKCTRKLDGGFGDKGRTPLGKALRRYLGLGKGRRARLGIVETKCLGICPKGAVVVVDAGAPAEWRLVRAGTPLDEIAAALRL